MTISDKIPCHPAKWFDEKRPMFAQPNGNEMYVLLLEKVGARLRDEKSANASGFMWRLP